MKKYRILLGIAFMSFLLVACKASKCDCPSFKKRGDVLKMQQNFTIESNYFKA